MKLHELIKIEKKLPTKIFYILQFITSATFMANSLSDLASNPSEETHKIKSKYGYNDKKKRNLQYCDCFIKYVNFQDNLIQWKCFCVVTKIISTSLTKS